MTTYKITKTQSETSTGRIVSVWNVVDASDDYVFDTFDRKGDAVAWIARVSA
jgi:hypothetical protein